ncbi:MAG: zf-HC2 domain-containing protein [Bryobacteraceae bacterium]
MRGTDRVAHIEERQVAAYWSGSLAPQELLRLDEHIEACAACRSLLSEGGPNPMPSVPVDDGAHLTFEDLSGYAAGKLEQSRRLQLEAHLTGCQSCRAESDDLRAFHRELQSRRRASQWWKIAAIAAALLLSVWGIGKLSRRPAPALVAAVQDNGRTIGLDPSGNLVGFSGEPQSAAQIKALIQTGRLLVAPLPDGVRTQATTFLGPGQATQPFVPIAPLARIVIEDRPAFSWTPLNGAASYRVQVMDDQFQPIADSGEQQSTTWQPATPLPREKVLIWQVSANRNGQLVRTPQPPLAEARFFIASKTIADRLAAVGSRQPVSHMELAAIYAAAGLREEAEQELRALAASNPGSPLVQRWLESLRREPR